MTLFAVHNKVLTLHRTRLIEAMDGTDLCTVKKRLFSALLLSSSLLYAPSLIPTPRLISCLFRPHITPVSCITD